ncbi:NfeD family protein [Fictibacillus sp. WQ 8-8]|uniref:NfeD family protein n=1 Tax=Fictibacillus marinisediminis TaxID=2878389 RepID=A0A9X1XD65_9BACL|nr:MULTISPECIES: NfeD family protein [Fictibacillus]MCK6258438.1 NfeD family protein [Fictibacillus marinisediminis]MCQ6264164.1 NfeD family protein [Fictibacillus sp. WQ 8-8]MED2974805.1 NfeD family protein [Fictibacillus sp. B-59209]
MDIMGYPMETIYLTGLIVFGCITFLYVLVSDLIHGAFEVFSHILSPTLVLSFFTILGACGYVLETITSVNSWFILGISAGSSLILVSLLNIFVLIPLASAEASLNYAEEDLRGRIGKVITSIPSDGFGEVFIEGISGNIAKTAISLDNEPIGQGSKILIVDVKSGVVHVMPYEQTALL